VSTGLGGGGHSGQEGLWVLQLHRELVILAGFCS
jgi:hypothetical protein